MSKYVDQAIELKKKVRVDKWGYHNIDDIHKYREEVEELNGPLVIEMNDLIDNNPAIRRYLNLKSEISRIGNVGNHFNVPK